MDTNQKKKATNLCIMGYERRFPNFQVHGQQRARVVSLYRREDR